jgi:ubiquinone/menaquinone biosynthesis C-methylase UbiE
VLKEGIHFLDVSCGTGWAVGQVAESVNNTGKFYGIDLAPKMIEKAKENFSGKQNLHFITANADSIPLESDFFDIIICSNSFHHYFHPDRVAKEFHRLLKKGGKVYILDATSDSLLEKLVDKIFRMLEPEHVKYHNTKAYQRFFQEVGLTYSASSGKVKGGCKIHIGEK